MKKRIVITGWSCLSSHGLSNEDFKNAFTSNIAYSLKDNWKKEGIGGQYFSEIPAFDILQELPTLKPPFPNRYSSLGILACLNALKDANLVEKRDLLERAGLIITTTLGASKSIQEFLEKLYTKGPDKLSPFVFSKATSNSILGDISRILKIKGPGSLIYGEESITYGIDLIQNNHAEIIVCGGVDELTEVSLQVAKEMNRLLEPNGEQVMNHINSTLEKGKYIYGEAASYVVIESLESALERDANIYAEIIDYKQYMDSVSNKVIFERSSDDLSNQVELFLKANKLDTSENILFYGSACLPWHVQAYEWEALRGTSYNYFYANSKISLGEGLSGSNNATIASAILGFQNEKFSNLFKNATILNTPPVNVTMDFDKLKSPEIILTNTFSLGGNNTLLLLKKYKAE
jgi:3-oxoacyl-[acyl-carrier-protein] synthase II